MAVFFIQKYKHQGGFYMKKMNVGSFFTRFSEFLGKYFVVLVVLVAIAALIFPTPFLVLVKTKFLGQSLVTIGLGIIMFIMGITMDEKDFKVILTNPKDIFIGCLAQFTIMPLIAFVLAKVLNLPSELAVGLVLLGTCPGGSASNVMTYLAKGDVALSVGMTTVSTLLAPILTPILTYFLAGQWVKIDIIVMVLDIFKVVIIPIFLGLVLHKLFKEKILKISKFLVVIPILTILMVMAMCVAPNRVNLINSGMILIVAVCVHNWLGFALGYMAGSLTRMNEAKKKALAIEVGLQNSGLAVGLSAQFGNPLCALPAAIATVIHQVSGSFIANVFSGNVDFKFFKFGKKVSVKY